MIAGDVAPFTGAWIEISMRSSSQESPVTSHPSRVRGLKFLKPADKNFLRVVAPFTGAWIEISKRGNLYSD